MLSHVIHYINPLFKLSSSRKSDYYQINDHKANTEITNPDDVITPSNSK